MYNRAVLSQQVLLPSLGFFAPRPEARISSNSNGSVTAEIDTAYLVALCEGHFPALPLVPGAHLLAIMYDLVVHCAGASSAATALIPSACVFRDLCKPDAPLKLTLSLGADAAVVTAYQSAESWLARGRITRSAELSLSCEPNDAILRRLQDGAGTPTSEPHAETEERRARVLRLKHRGKALLLDAELGDDDAGRAQFLSVRSPDWHWPLLLDAAAQAAGLSAKSALGDFEGTLVVVAYNRISRGRPTRDARLLFRTRTVRKVRGMLQQEVEAFQRCGSKLDKVLQLEVTLAPLPSAVVPSGVNS